MEGGARERSDRGGLDELLTPSLEGQRTPGAYAEQPWRLGSMVYVAFFGGVLAVTAIAIVNAGRLRMPQRTMGIMGTAGVIGLAGALAAASLVDSETSSAARIAARIVALAAYGVHFLLMRSADRVYHYHQRGDDPYDSLVGPGLIACFTLGIVEAFLISAVR